MGLNATGGTSAGTPTQPAVDPRNIAGKDPTGQYYVDHNGNKIGLVSEIDRAAANFANDPNQGGSGQSTVFGSRLAGDLLTKDNPVAGTLNAADDLTHGDIVGAASDFAQGTSYGTLPQLKDGQVQPGDTISNVVPGVNPNSISVAGDAISGAAGAAATGVGQVLDAAGNIISGAGGSSGPAPAMDDEFRRRQLEYADQLKAAAEGTAGPSAAEIQGRNLNDRAMAQQFAAAQGATGQNSALAYRQALQTAAGMQNQQTADATANRARETAQARDQYGNLLTGGRSGDLQKYGTDVGSSNVRYAADQDLKGKEIAAVTGAGSGIIAGLVSDERKKTDITDGDDEVREMLDALKAHDFHYKNPNEAGAAPGQRTGIMAQDLERSSAGRALVRDTPGGKEIDSPQAIGAMLAALAELNSRVKRVEAKHR